MKGDVYPIKLVYGCWFGSGLLVFNLLPVKYGFMNREIPRIVREELWRSIAWFGLALVGWPILVDELAWLEQNLFTVFGLPVVTCAVLTAGMIGIRTVSGAELQYPLSSSGVLLWGAILGVLTGVYLIAVEGYSPLLVVTGEVAAAAATVAWYWYAGVFDSSTEPAG
ncbi:hypothetical protein [Halorientalis regularis]|uniref:hypothetical protein n=1 Tax=Halorientalis regularis TaxID=660518 RepID=UPI0011142451|nr:hypothetical protein [Halorientalis regularis]